MPTGNDTFSLTQNRSSLLSVSMVSLFSEWTPHIRQLSTTVNFTTEELKAFKSRKKSQESVECLPEYVPNEDISMSQEPFSGRALSGISRTASLGQTLHQGNDETYVNNKEKDSCDTQANETLSGFKDDSVVVNDLNETPENCPLLDCSSPEDSGSSDAHLISSPESSSCLSHDGPITAHPATVTEEYSSSSSNPGSPESDHNKVNISCPTSYVPTTPLVSSVSTPNISTLGDYSISGTTYHRTLSGTGTCPSMTSSLLSSEDGNIIVLGYGRTPNSAEISCNKLGEEFVKTNNVDNKLLALLGKPFTVTFQILLLS